MQTDLNNIRGNLNSLAHKLVASTFYADVRKTHTGDPPYRVTAVIRCRFPDDTNDIRHLGQWLMQNQNVRFQPYFLYESEQDARLVKVVLSADIIQK